MDEKLNETEEKCLYIATKILDRGADNISINAAELVEKLVNTAIHIEEIRLRHFSEERRYAAEHGEGITLCSSQQSGARCEEKN